MRVDYFAQRTLHINNMEVPLGTRIATVEVPDGIPLEKAVNAIAVGHATPDPVPSGAGGQDKKKEPSALETAGEVKIVDEGHDR